MLIDTVAGDRRQETGDRRQETGDRRQETAPLLISAPSRGEESKARV